MLKIILTRLLTQHLKKVHNIVIEKAKSNHPLIHEGGLNHQEHVWMNKHILSDTHVIQQ
jgi:hypothetical protein